MKNSRCNFFLIFLLSLLFAVPAGASEQEVNIFSARKYVGGETLFENFTKETGIKVNVLSGNASDLVEAIKNSGAESSADIYMAVDGGVMNAAKLAGILQPTTSSIIDQVVPEHLKDKDSHWIALTTRARIIVYSKERVKPQDLSTYEDLADPKWKGRITVRPSVLYDQSLLASMIAVDGEEKAEAWAKGVASNLANAPKGNDRQRAKDIAAGNADVGLMNTYYLGVMSKSKDPEEVKAAEEVAVFFPNQDTTGTHINVSGIGLVKNSPNRENAIRLIEFLLSPESQKLLSEQNFVYPVNPQAEMSSMLKSWGPFKVQKIDFAVYGDNNAKARQILDEAGWK